MQTDADNAPRCSFCGKRSVEVQRLIAGASAHICDECVTVCNAIIADDQTQDSPDEDKPQCIFCDAPQTETTILIHGPHASICYDCVQLCYTIVIDRQTAASQP